MRGFFYTELRKRIQLARRNLEHSKWQPVLARAAAALLGLVILWYIFSDNTVIDPSLESDDQSSKGLMHGGQMPIAPILNHVRSEEDEPDAAEPAKLLLDAQETSDNIEKLVRAVMSFNYDQAHIPEGAPNPDQVAAPPVFDGVFQGISRPEDEESSRSSKVFLIASNDQVNCRNPENYICSHVFYMRCFVFGEFAQVEISTDVHHTMEHMKRGDILVFFFTDYEFHAGLDNKIKEISHRRKQRELDVNGIVLGVFFLGDNDQLLTGLSGIVDFATRIPIESPGSPKGVVEVPRGPRTPAQCLPEWISDLALYHDKAFCRCLLHVRPAARRALLFNYLYNKTDPEAVGLKATIRAEFGDPLFSAIDFSLFFSDKIGDIGCDRRFGAEKSHVDTVTMEGRSYESMGVYTMHSNRDSIRLDASQESECPAQNVNQKDGFCDHTACKTDPKYTYSAALQHSIFTLVPCTLSSFRAKDQLLWDAVFLHSIPVVQRCDNIEQTHSWLLHRDSLFIHAEQMLTYLATFTTLNDKLAEDLNVMQRSYARAMKNQLAAVATDVYQKVLTAQNLVRGRYA